MFEAIIAEMLATEERNGTRIAPLDHEVVVDGASFDAMLASLAVKQESAKTAELSILGRSVRVSTWERTATCEISSGVRRCRVPAAVTVIRFFKAAWLKPGESLTIVVGAYHRAQYGKRAEGVGGSGWRLFLERRDGRWMVTKKQMTFQS